MTDRTTRLKSFIEGDLKDAERALKMIKEQNPEWAVQAHVNQALANVQFALYYHENGIKQ